jgi:hypothetical protein
MVYAAIARNSLFERLGGCRLHYFVANYFIDLPLDSDCEL